ncbi:hypothetical protein BT63DRAFT_421620 [Microthyrium microscopicum]|uniref:MOSC domain-containing protein n=1 Tax=Microthyrium microscopicum TaxID=703497 RepID=A0A6A6UP31_9PEZI|nr:hypothetical protein BT63DRAFT_421620 [Microthyrium microscopicum]
MSCPAHNAPIKERLQALDDDAELPTAFYWMSAGMVFLVIGIPFIYRWTWLFLWDIISGVRQDLGPPKRPEGCRRLGRKAERNLSDETFTLGYKEVPRSASFPKPSESDLENSISKEYANTGLEGRIEALYLHPIKSTAPIEVDSATVTPLGLAHDRLFSFAHLESKLPDLDGNTEHSWHFITQRESAQLALVQTELWIPDPDAEDYDEDSIWVKNGGCIIVRFPFTSDYEYNRTGIRAFISEMLLRRRSKGRVGNMVEFRVPLVPCEERIKEKAYQLDQMRIWKEFPESWDMASEIDPIILRKLAYTLGISNSVTLFRVRDGFERELYKNAPSVEDIGFQTKVGLQDAYPISVQNMSSIYEVEKKVQEVAKKKGKSYRPDSRRFRSNIYISGPTAFSEVHMKRLAIQGRSTSDAEDQKSSEPPEPIVFALPCRIPRCKMPNNDPLLGVRDDDVFQPLSYLNKEWRIDPGASSGILGMMAIAYADSLHKEIRVGDEVVFYKHGEHVYNKIPDKEKWTPSN